MSRSVTGLLLVQKGFGSRRLADEGGDPAHEAGDVALLVVEQPLPELVGGLDDGLRPRHPPRVEAVPQTVVEGVRREQQLGEDSRVLERLRATLGQRGRTGVRGVTDDDDPSSVPRGAQDVGLELGVVDPARVVEGLADVVPRTVVGRRQLPSSWPAARRA